MEIIVRDNDGKEIVCLTAKEAAKVAKRIEREATKREAEDRVKRELAYVYAGNSIASMLDRMDRGKDETRGWTFEANHHDVKSNTWGDSARYQTEQGTVTTDHTGYRVSGFLWNGAGFDIAVRLVDKDTNDPVWFAVGIYEDRIAFKDIPFSLHTKIDPWLSIV